MTTAHRDASLLRAIADGKQMQVEGLTAPWMDASGDDALIALAEGQPCRIKPEFIVINGVECDASQRRKADFFVCITLVGHSRELLAEGVFYWPNKDAARTAFEALIKPFKECQE